MIFEHLVSSVEWWDEIRMPAGKITLYVMTTFVLLQPTPTHCAVLQERCDRCRISPSISVNLMVVLIQTVWN